MFSKMLQLNDIIQWNTAHPYSLPKSIEMGHLRTKFDGLKACPDVPIVREDGVGAGRERPHILQGRTETDLTQNTINIITMLAAAGWNIYLCVGVNRPSINRGASKCMGGMGFKDGLTPENVYTIEKLSMEMIFLGNVINKVGPKLAGLYLGLEPASMSAGWFAAELAKKARQWGWEKPLLLNAIGELKHAVQGAYGHGPLPHGILRSYSINAPSTSQFISKWRSSRSEVRDCDGMKITSSNAKEIMPVVTGEPGPNGSVTYLSEYDGSSDGPDRLPDWVMKYAV